jgi:septum formation protein
MNRANAKVILGSSSPRRAELLREAGYQFDIIPPGNESECGVCSGETPPETVARLALQKARDVASRIQSGLLITCDTVAECQGLVLGKPAHEEHARQMLRILRGREHRVYSGLCVWDVPESDPLIQVEATLLRMDPITDVQLEDYLASDQWVGKAGAFGYQDRLGWVHIVQGSASNVVGLPMELLTRMLAEVSE